MDTMPGTNNARINSNTMLLLLVIVGVAVAVLLTCCVGGQGGASSSAAAPAEQAKPDKAEEQVRADNDADEKLEPAAEQVEPQPADKDADATGAKEDEGEKAKLSPAEVERIDSMRSAIRAAVDASGMTCGVAVVDLDGNLDVSVGGDTQMASASMIKMLIAYSFLEQVQARRYALDDLYTLQGSDIVGGSGTLSGLGVGAQVSYRDILMRMIDVSDNTGANILIDACGIDTINATAKRLGLDHTELNRHMMDYDAMSAGLENYTCADDLAALMRMVYEGSFVDAASSDVVMTALRQQQDRGGIVDGLPAGVAFAHKTGELDTVTHDGGIVEGDHPFVLVVLCGGEGFWPQGAYNAMASIARITYDGIIR